MSTDLIDQMVAEGKLPTVKEELERDQEPGNPTPDSAFVPPRLEDYSVDLPQPGIHFGVPDEVYHSWPALSCSGIRKLAASPTLFYMTTPWLNPDYEQPEEKAWASVGKAYHARILEGREAFNERFCVKLEKASIEGLCCTIDDIKVRISEVHGKVPFGKKKEDFVAQLLELEPDAPIWEECQRRYEEENGGKCQLPYDVILRIETAAKMIELHEELSKAVSGGHAEVSFFYYCPKTGIPMKARVDYLKLKAMVDLKSYENKFDLSPEFAIPKSIANQRYPLQPSVYLEAAQAVKEIIRKSEGAAIYDADGKPAANDRRDWALKWAQRKEEPEWLWIFQQKGVAPITRGIYYPTGGTMRLLFDEIVSRAKKRFRACALTFGTDTWLDIAPINDTFADEDIAPWAADI
jgi:hypothetical protein